MQLFTRNHNDTNITLTNNILQTYTTMVPINEGIIFKMEITEIKGGRIQVARYEDGKSNTYHNMEMSQYGKGIISIECLPNTTYFKHNGEIKMTINNSPKTNARFFIVRNNGESCNFNYKNLIIYNS